MTKAQAEKIVDESLSELAQIISKGASWEIRKSEVDYITGLLTGLYYGDVLNALEYNERTARLRTIQYGKEI